ncbi:hypothetical protein FF041_35275 [Streptomyces jumonjinensis]|uniref:Uncharacterized protein n=1 Tax=Streptomyces jumonjinensis TaxID=1945 RepID=A0A646KTJ8_STRJU|nr:hypothetical protein [Streptomyces jumonjinensis]
MNRNGIPRQAVLPGLTTDSSVTVSVRPRAAVRATRTAPAGPERARPSPWLIRRGRAVSSSWTARSGIAAGSPPTRVAAAQTAAASPCSPSPGPPRTEPAP